MRWPVLFAITLASVAAEVNGIAVTGIDTPAMSSFDRIITALMRKYDVPGGQVTVAKAGKIVFAHGYGFADREANQLVEPNSLFRIASLSKPFTAVTVLKLVEMGKLRLDDKPFPLLGLAPPHGGKPDPRLANITIRELLQHTGGWDRDIAFDPMFIPIKAATALGAPAPASCETIIRYMLGQPLQHDPGTIYAYSNFGYCVLGRVIEKVTGQSYEQYVRNEILSPMGIHDMHTGHTFLDQRFSNEVKYYDFPGASEVNSVFPRRPGKVPEPYGGFYLEAMDSHGAWIASGTDLLRFMLHVDGRMEPVPLKPATVREMLAMPDRVVRKDPEVWYGMGWQVRHEGNDANWWHTGSLPGTTTILVRTWQGMHWAALFNTRPKSSAFAAELDIALWKAAGEVREWPSREITR